MFNIDSCSDKNELGKLYLLCAFSMLSKFLQEVSITSEKFIKTTIE